jgi:hypothetical protein
MGCSSRHALASLFLAFAILDDNASAQTPTVSIETEYVMTFEEALEPPQPVGQRLIVNVPAGSVHGPKVNGSFVPPAGDWLIPMADGSIRLDVRGTIKTDDGEFIFVEFSGVIVPTKEIMDRFGKGEVIGSKEEYFIIAPKFSTASKKYEWLNHVQAVGKMVSLQNTKVKYDVFVVR